jgi:hypothetical protein
MLSCLQVPNDTIKNIPEELPNEKTENEQVKRVI